MTPSHLNPGPVALGGDRRKEASGVAGVGLLLVKRGGFDVIHLGTVVRYAGRGDHHRQELQNLHRRDAEAESEDVFVAAEGVIGVETGDVPGVVEVAVTFGGNVSGAILAAAGRPVRARAVARIRWA